MLKMLEQFLESIKVKKHVLQLFRERQILLGIESEGESVFLKFHDGTVSFSDSDVTFKEKIQIYCTNDSLRDLFEGTKLRDLLKHQQIKMTSSYRNTLLLESVFYLCKQKMNNFK